MKSILIIVRTEADFERAIAIGIAGKSKFKQHFVFVGDFSPFFKDGIQNKFQKKMFQSHGFIMHDFSEFDFWGRILRKFSKKQIISFEKVRENRKLFLPFLFFIVFKKYLIKNKKRIIKNIFREINPVFLLTDQSMTHNNYLPEQIRSEALKRNIPVFIFTHGAAGGLHSEFSNPVFVPYDNYTVFACNSNETNPEFKNRIILGDMSSSFPYVHYLNNSELEELNFLNERKYKIVFIVGGTGPYTSTTGWFIQEEIIIELSENKDVAMVLKLHPRETQFIDLRMLEKFDNLLIVSRETDRSRVTKWADIIICSDHCSTVFEPMILGKKVVAIEGKHVPKFGNNYSPLKYSSVKHISSAKEFNLNSIQNADPEDSVTNLIAWGNNGKLDLAKLAFEKIETTLTEGNNNRMNIKK